MNTRPDLELIARMIPEKSRVLDLGCGDGRLLRMLMDKGCTGTGVEIDPAQVLTAIRAGVNVIDLDLDSQLSEFTDDSYDVVVLSRTLQAVRRPKEVLREIARIAVHSVVSMPNFAHWRNRLRLLSGRMPMSKDLPFDWFDTPNLHFTTLADRTAVHGAGSQGRPPDHPRRSRPHQAVRQRGSEPLRQQRAVSPARRQEVAGVS